MRALLVVLVAACGSSSDTCRTDQIEVSYLGGARDGQNVCAAIPASCAGAASCSVMACIHDMYGLCESPYIGVGCSDTFPPTIISCNP